MKKLPDLSKFDEICDNDEEFKAQMLAILIKEFPLEKKAFLNSIERKSYRESAEIVHKLKHKINLLNLGDGYLLASKFESQLFNDSTELYDEFIIIINQIEEFLKKL